MTQIRFSIRIGGPAGVGIASSGQILAKIFSRAGFNVLMSGEYYSLIRGGHNYTTVEASDQPIYALKKDIEILIALDNQTINEHKNSLSKNGIIIFDPLKINPEEVKAVKNRLSPIPFTKLTQAVGGQPVMANMASLGAVLAIIGQPIDELLKLISEMFSRKGEKVVELNQKVVQAGFNFPDKPNLKIASKEVSAAPIKTNQCLLSGNQVAALGAMSAGLKFFAGYPMTPATGIMEFLAEWAEEYNIVVKHSEDEIAASLMAIGAGFAGARAMTATSGGGLCLMVESFGLATIAEVPLVVVDCQRPGPATGLPTRTSQGDLKLVAYGTVDSAPRIVLSPGDHTEIFYLTKLAFNLAEIYQTPVFILLDKYLAESQASVLDLKSDLVKIDRGQSRIEQKANYNRFAFTADSISPRVLPGEAHTTYAAVGNEHNEFGDISEEPKNRELMLEKRTDKIAKVRISVGGIIKPIKVYGSKKAKQAIVFWGSPKGAILEAIRDSKSIKAIGIMQLRPFPQAEFLQAIKGARELILVENNFDGQLGDLIREQTGIKVDRKILRYDGRPFQFEDIKSELEIKNQKLKTSKA